MGYNRLIIASCVLAFVVIVLGAFTRLTDAGLGCPDWPGCYGEMVVPNDPGADDAWPERLETSFDGEPVGVLSRRHLIQNKSAAGRPQDLADIQYLLRLPETSREAARAYFDRAGLTEWYDRLIERL